MKVVIGMLFCLFSSSLMAGNAVVLKAVLENDEVENLVFISKVEVVAQYRCPQCFDVLVHGERLISAGLPAEKVLLKLNTAEDISSREIIVKVIASSFHRLERAEVKIAAKIPAADILVAARKIRAQTVPGYFVEGLISCESHAVGVQLGNTQDSCVITMDGRNEAVENSDKIVAVVRKLEIISGPAASFQGKFTAHSISGEVPPYEVDEEAEVLLFN